MALEFPNGSDVLPPGRHSASVLEVEAALVGRFPASARRRPLYQRWLAVREAIRRIVVVEKEWLDGSYVTREQEPQDIDMVSHLPHDTVDGLDEAGKAMLLGLIAGYRSRDLHACDSFVLVAYPDGHPQHAVYQQVLRYWDNLFGHDRSGTPKGFVEVTE
jgi:hypothetical protein